MSLISPLALLAAAIIGPIIVAMYLLKLRREERTVSSTFLWRQVIRDVEANAPWQKLRYNLLLLLQLLLMFLLVFALARPFFATQGISGRNLIIILDRSASMAARDTPPSRLAAAKATAIQLIDQLPDGGRATLILVGGTLEVPAAASSDRRELRASIEQVTLANGGGSDLSQALTLAAALAARDEQSEVAIISDGNLTLPSDIRVPARVSYFPIGNSSENVGISGIALQPGQNTQTLFVQVSNYGSQPIERRLDLYLDGAIFNAYNLNLAPDPTQSQSIVVEVPPTVQLVEARLAGDDLLPADDRAFAVSTLGEQLDVRLISSGNHFLETGLALLPNINLSSSDEGELPLSIIDGEIPTNLPAGNLLFIGPLRSTDYFSVTGQIDFPSLRAVSSGDPVLQNVSLSDVSVLKAARIIPGSWARVLVSSDGAPMLMVGERDGRRIAVLAFDLHNSDLPLQIAFPLLLSNLIEYLAPGGSGAQLNPGQPLVLPLDPSINEVRITRPDSSQVSSGNAAIQIREQQAIYADTDMLGVYQIEEWRDGSIVNQRNYAVNADRQESLIRPQSDLLIPQTSGAESTAARDRDGKQEIWRWLALAALIVLVIEWLVYQRNGLIMLRQRWMR
ncbi:vWA domain-containing protein [Candidatus Oscillochloris fontis]|uniref:vWA domain-containing protein n=1 Tax=Candidatus Oscillochloris fontis TaxID=2496868 RepID=UPI00101C4E36|nr:BatA and WFA domain-containing protein [Candidatus Oscillochloris fontis]